MCTAAEPFSGTASLPKVLAQEVKSQIVYRADGKDGLRNSLSTATEPQVSCCDCWTLKD